MHIIKCYPLLRKQAKSTLIYGEDNENIYNIVNTIFSCRRLLKTELIYRKVWGIQVTLNDNVKHTHILCN